MRVALIAALLVGQSLLCACTSVDGEGSGGLSDFGSSLGGGIGHNTDTYGTQRRPDVNGYSTAPSLPTIGTVGYGK